MNSFDTSHNSCYCQRQMYTKYPNARVADIKHGGDFPYVAYAEDVNLHIQVHYTYLVEWHTTNRVRLFRGFLLWSCICQRFTEGVPLIQVHLRHVGCIPRFPIPSSPAEPGEKEGDLPEIVPLELILGESHSQAASATEATSSPPHEEKEEPERSPDFVLQRSSACPSPALEPNWREEDGREGELAPAGEPAEAPIDAPVGRAGETAAAAGGAVGAVAGEWVSYADASGDTFYYHQASGESQWDPPEGFVEPREGDI